MSNFLHWFIIIISVGSFLGCVWLIWWSSRPRPGEAASGEETGHTWDGDLAEYNNPLPRWWLWLFYLSIVIGLGYMVFYPALGNFAGTGKWTQVKQYEEEMQRADDKYGALYKQYAEQPIPQLASNTTAMKTGQRLFINHCSTCHGSDAGGATGFPSLKDRDWLYGSSPEAIKTSIINGRNGVMPPFAAAVGGEQGVDEVANYVMSLSGAPHDANKALAGKAKFAVCAGCHGPEGKGNQAIGAPNLTDDIWLYRGSIGAVKKAINEGLNNMMPAQLEYLGEQKAHLLAAYIYSLSQSQ
jgi:cytochrome c oxidase cbb3-type subunit 3